MAVKTKYTKYGGLVADQVSAVAMPGPLQGVAKMVVEDGLVMVDGNVEFRKRCKLKSGQTVEFDGTFIELE